MDRADDRLTERARRAAIRDALTSSGMDPVVAERWCGAWEAEAKLRGLEPGGDYWDVGERWIDTQCSLRLRPPN